MRDKINIITLFSGYDSQCMALDKLGIDYDLVAWCEIDKAAIKAHDAVYPQFKDRNLGDIMKVDWTQWSERKGKVDCVTYSSPCQSYSRTGRKAGGTKGSETASSLLWYVKPCIDAIKPRTLVMENVENLVKEFTTDVEQWSRELQELGYASYMAVLNAADFGIPQARRRLFLVSLLEEDAKKQGFCFPHPMGTKLGLNDFLSKGEVAESTYLNDAGVSAFLDCPSVIRTPGREGCLVKRIPTPTCHTDNDQEYGLAPTLKAACSTSVSFRYLQSTGFYPIFGVFEIWDCGDGILRHYTIGKKFKNATSQSKSAIIEAVENLCPGQYIRVRRATVVEVLRLMGVNMEHIRSMLKARCKFSDLYMLAGNSIVVDVLTCLFDYLFLTRQ